MLMVGLIMLYQRKILILSAGGIGIYTTNAISATNGGTFTSAGGAAVAKKLFVGTDLSVAGNSAVGTQLQESMVK
jgi:hypothetical protein